MVHPRWTDNPFKPVGREESEEIEQGEVGAKMEHARHLLKDESSDEEDDEE